MHIMSHKPGLLLPGCVHADPQLELYVAAPIPSYSPGYSVI